MKKLKVAFVAEFKSIINKYTEMIEAEMSDVEG